MGSTSDSDAYVSALRTFYNGIGERYNSGETGGFHRQAASVLVDAAGTVVKKGSWVLDLGTGTGMVAFAAAAQVGPTGHVLGVDISDGFLAHATQTASELGVQEFVEFLHQDINHLALPEAYSGHRPFDAILCGSALMLFPSPSNVVRTAATQLLKPGGIFVADTHTGILGTAFFNTAAEHGVKTRLDPIWFNDPEAAFRELFENAGFDVKSVATTPRAHGEMKWDFSSLESTEKIWQTMAVNAPWATFGIDSETLAKLKPAWLQKIEVHKDAEGMIMDSMTQYLVAAVCKE